MGVELHNSHSHDAVLVASSVAGDHGAFRQLFETYAPGVYRIACRMLGEQEEAADLTQDVFVRAYQRLASLRDGQAFHAWITRLAVNMAHDRARRAKPRPLSLDAPLPGSDGSFVWEIADDAAGSEARVLSGELSARVQAALMALSAEHRIVVVLHHLEGLPVDEIGALLGVPSGTVKSRLSRARAELRQRLAGYVEGEE